MKPRRHGNGFTIIEVMLALVLASVVLAVMVGVLQTMTSADVVSAQRVDEQTDLAVAQNLMRRVFVSLAAVEPLDPAAMRAQLQAERAAKAGENAEGQEAEEAEADTAERDQEGLEPMAPPDIEPMFDLYFTELNKNAAAPVLDCVVLDPPGALRPGAGAVTLESFRGIAKGATREGMLMSRRIVQTVRGRFEVVPINDDQYGLVWRGLDPPSEPVVLIRDVVDLEWWVLPIDEGVRQPLQTMSAKLAADFPIAIRLSVWTGNGQHHDWEFEAEAQVIAPEREQPNLAPPTEQTTDEAEDAT